jgi:glycosyltransferase involved in cell wall biosynthesis
LAIRNFHLLRALSEEFRVRAFALRAPHLPQGTYPHGVEATEIPQSGRVQRRALALLASAATGKAYSPLLYRSGRLERELERAAGTESPAWVVAHSYHVGPLAVESGSPAWIDFHNLDSQIWARMGETAASPLTRWFAASQTPRVRAFESRLASSAAGLSCVSEPDAAALVELAPSARPLLVPNGVDLSRYVFRPEPAAEKLLFFVGDLSWPPNAEGIRWFRRQVWPLVLARHPDASAEILGREPPRDLARESVSNFRLLGEGEDTRPLWRRAAVALVPLRAGGGTRLKILEAAASGVPVVSTSVGAEGLDLVAGEEILLADDERTFADEVASLLADPAKRERIARAARARVASLYDWTAIGRRLAERLLERGAA